MRRRTNDIVPLGDVLNTLAGRLRKVDLRLIDELRALWPEIVDEAIAKRCRPSFIKNGILVVSVPSGAYAERIKSDEEVILQGLARLGAAAPTSLRTVLDN